MEELIKFENVDFSYEEEPDTTEEQEPAQERTAEATLAIKNLNLTIRKGEYVAILGHNGSGKSTLAKLCNGILVPDHGTVTSYGIDTKDEEQLMELRQHIGMVFQNPDNQIVATIVEEDVAFGPENLGVPPEEIRQRVDYCLKAVGMEQYKMHEPHKLSGGQKQRVAIAGILAMEPECIILDESTAMLDPRGRKEVMNTVRKMHEELGLTVIFITHFMEEAATASRAIVMDQGQILSDGTPYEVFRNAEQLKQVGLDVPQATEFSQLLQKSGISMPEDILTTEECVAALSAVLKEN